MQREAVRCIDFQEDVRSNLEPHDMLRISFEAVTGPLGKFAQVLLTAWPSTECELSAPQFFERAARYFGQPSPACALLVGEPINPKYPSVVVDPYGGNLEGARMRGDGWRHKHDAVKFALEHAMLAMSITPEVEVFNLFADLFSPSQINDLDNKGDRHRQGLVPDFQVPKLTPRFHKQLAELKGITLTKTHYPTRESTHSRSTREACAHRGRAIEAEYLRKACYLDRTCQADKYSPPAPGPVQERLHHLGPILPLVFGAFNDVNQELEGLVSAMASAGAVSLWRQMLQPDYASAKGVLMWQLRRDIGMEMHRANADLILDRVRRVGGRAEAAAGRRAHSARTFFGASGPSEASYAFRQSSRGAEFSRPHH